MTRSAAAFPKRYKYEYSDVMKMLADLLQLDMLADLASSKFKRQKDATKTNTIHKESKGYKWHTKST